MNYTVSLLSTRPDCQALIDIANREKGTLEYRKTGVQRQRETATITSLEIEADLLTITAEIQAYQSLYNSMPEGQRKQEMFNTIKKMEYKKFLLEQRKENYGVLALLEKEFDIATIDRCITESDDFIAQLTVRLNELPQ